MARGVQAIDQRVFFSSVKNPQVGGGGQRDERESRGPTVNLHELTRAAQRAGALIEDASGHADIFVFRVARQRGQLLGGEGRGAS